MTSWLIPQWPAPGRVRSLLTTRAGGVSQFPFDALNLADHVGDEPFAVTRNRQILRDRIGVIPVWLNQVHGVEVVDAARSLRHGAGPPQADAAFARERGVACAVLTADCLPVLLCDRSGTVVAAAHAGWRGLCAGVLEATVGAMGCAPPELIAWIGPAIGPEAFEVGEEVVEAFAAHDPRSRQSFAPAATVGKWLGNLPALAGQRLADAGVGTIAQSGLCTVRDSLRFYSYRRDGRTGRFASLIWLVHADEN